MVLPPQKKNTSPPKKKESSLNPAYIFRIFGTIFQNGIKPEQKNCMEQILGAPNLHGETDHPGTDP